MTRLEGRRVKDRPQNKREREETKEKSDEIRRQEREPNDPGLQSGLGVLPRLLDSWSSEVVCGGLARSAPGFLQIADDDWPSQSVGLVDNPSVDSRGVLRLLWIGRGQRYLEVNRAGAWGQDRMFFPLYFAVFQHAAGPPRDVDENEIKEARTTSASSFRGDEPASLYLKACHFETPQLLSLSLSIFNRLQRRLFAVVSPSPLGIGTLRFPESCARKLAICSRGTSNLSNLSNINTNPSQRPTSMSCGRDTLTFTERTYTCLMDIASLRICEPVGEARRPKTRRHTNKGGILGEEGTRGRPCPSPFRLARDKVDWDFHCEPARPPPIVPIPQTFNRDWTDLASLDVDGLRAS
ncbi:hypothetical protein CSIM01_00920 [Colletotrichum simmondsii]|uniref:Uncharacterized protein n=1 Tax=Colletotrichum simmondsii TaxID=703756 RepID=A0A135RZU8_9PEZI|nr:hypothetical protein CSIM01_00920 [Colletotrichum simmondsii]